MNLWVVGERVEIWLGGFVGGWLIGCVVGKVVDRMDGVLPGRVFLLSSSIFNINLCFLNGSCLAPLFDAL